MKTNIPQSLYGKLTNDRTQKNLLFMLIAILLSIMSVIVQTFDWVIKDNSLLLNQLIYLFNVNKSGNVSVWFTAFLLSYNALICFFIAILSSHKIIWQRYYWVIAGFGCLVIIYLKVIGSPKNIGRLILSEMWGGNYLIWGILGILLILVLLHIYYGFRFLLSLPIITRKWLLLASLIYLGAAIGLERIGSIIFLTTYIPNIVYQYVGVIEEFFELVGIITLQFALLQHLSLRESSAETSAR